MPLTWKPHAYTCRHKRFDERTLLLAVVAADYVIRAVAGPRFSPLARLGMVARQWLRLPENPTAGPPKRFAATVGAGMMVLAAVLGLAGQATAAYVAGGIMVLLPALESFTGFCAGCAIFGQLMRWNLIPEEVCEACADIAGRR